MKNQKTKRNRTAPSRSVQRLVRALGKKLWRVGLAARVEHEGYDSKAQWSGLSSGQLAAWDAIASHVMKVKRPNSEIRRVADNPALPKL